MQGDKIVMRWEKAQRQSLCLGSVPGDGPRGPLANWEWQPRTARPHRPCVPEHPQRGRMLCTPRVVRHRGTPRLPPAHEHEAQQGKPPLPAGWASAGDAAAGWGPSPPRTPAAAASEAPGRAQGRALPGSSLLEGEDEGRYLVGSPRLFVRPVLVVADVPPLYLKGVGGGTAASEGASHLHVLARLGRHVVGGLGEEGCGRQSEGCGCRWGHATTPQGTCHHPTGDDATGHTSRVTRSTQTLPQPGRPGTSVAPSDAQCPLPNPAEPPAPPRHFAKSSERKGRQRRFWAPSLPRHPRDPPPQSRHGTPPCLQDVINK